MVYCTLALGLVVLVATLAFSARQPPPPQIAELTPQAQHQITKAPNQLTSSLGSAAGGPGGAGGKAATTTTAPPGAGNQPGASSPVTVVSAHHCFGNPPIQIDTDTQVPPCVAYWAGSNGGSTWMGVTSTQVTIPMFVPDAISEGNAENGSRVLTDLSAFFNRYFEFYGRRVDFFQITTTADMSSCAADNATADGLVREYRPFALGDIAAGGPCYFQELARDHVISVDYDMTVSLQELDAWSPFIYTYAMPYDGQFAEEGAFICAQLAGKQAVYSPDPVIQSETRKFGLIALTAGQDPYPYDTAPLADQLRRCGSPLQGAEVEPYSDENSTWDTDTILKMKRAGVTTVVCVCASSSLFEAASEQDYHPEWILESGAIQVTDQHIKDYFPPDQQKSIINLSFEPAYVPYPDTTLNRALATVDPGFAIDEELDYSNLQNLYWEMLELSSGIQMAGPDLTPQTFLHGLQNAHFPNPYSPDMEGAASFALDPHAMTTDAAVSWFDPTGPDVYPDMGPGAWCYVDGAERFSIAKGNWGAPMNPFSLGCESSPPGS